MMPKVRDVDLGGARSVKDGPPATRELVINVTRAHIDDGVKGDVLRCPLARAMSAAGVDMALASSVVISGMVDGESFAVSPSMQLEQFITAFDEGAAVQPFAFQLTVPIALRDPQEAIDA